MKDTRGFTVIEILVAITVFSLGILSLTATSSLVTRMVGESYQYSEASTIAIQQFELLRSQDCNTLTAGSAAHGKFLVSWSIDSVGSRKPGRLVGIDVTFPTASGDRDASFSSMFFCPK